MTRILAFDTSSEACSVALSLDGEVLEHYELAPRQHTRKLLPMIESLLAEAELSLQQLDAIGFGAGPGSFTGLRITTGAAQGLALGAELPLIPVSTLAALALQAHQATAVQWVFSALDARMSELYWGAYHVSADSVTTVTPEQVCSPENVIIPELSVLKNNWVGVGPGWNYQQLLPEAIRQAAASYDAEIQPSAGAMATIAAWDFSEGKGLDPADALPTYLRNEVAWKKSNHRQQ